MCTNCFCENPSGGPLESPKTCNWNDVGGTVYFETRKRYTPYGPILAKKPCRTFLVLSASGLQQDLILRTGCGNRNYIDDVEIPAAATGGVKTAALSYFYYERRDALRDLVRPILLRAGVDFDGAPMRLTSDYA